MSSALTCDPPRVPVRTARAPAASTPRQVRRLQVPPQHGAWAFLAVPLILGLAISGVTWPGVLFSVTWVLAYPASYYLGRAIAVRTRRGVWSRIARRERAAAVPWVVAAGGVDEEQVRSPGEAGDGVLEERPAAQGQQAGDVRSAAEPMDCAALHDAAAAPADGGRHHALAGIAGSALAAGEGGEHGHDVQSGEDVGSQRGARPRGLPRRRRISGGGQLALEGLQLRRPFRPRPGSLVHVCTITERRRVVEPGGRWRS